MKIQSVVITLSDGRQGVFTGEVLVEKELKPPLTITRVQFIEPREVPGIKLTPISELVAEQKEVTP